MVCKNCEAVRKESKNALNVGLAIAGSFVTREFEPRHWSSLFSLNKKLKPNCLILVSSRNGFESDNISYKASFGIELE